MCLDVFQCTMTGPTKTALAFPCFKTFHCWWFLPQTLYTTSQDVKINLPLRWMFPKSLRSLQPIHFLQLAFEFIEANHWLPSYGHVLVARSPWQRAGWANKDCPVFVGSTQTALMYSKGNCKMCSSSYDLKLSFKWQVYFNILRSYLWGLREPCWIRNIRLICSSGFESGLQCGRIAFDPVFDPALTSLPPHPWSESTQTATR